MLLFNIIMIEFYYILELLSVCVVLWGWVICGENVIKKIVYLFFSKFGVVKNMNINGKSFFVFFYFV